jgi:indoleamine 2,3-dioxygenase
MEHECWNIWRDRGFLVNPEPLISLSDVLHFPPLAHLESVANELPVLLETRTLRQTLDTLPVYDLSMLHLETIDCYIAERLMQIYSYFASAYVYAITDDTAHRIPAGVAVPLAQLAQRVERPPILSYTNYVLNNWRRIDPDAPITVDNLELNQKFLGNKDEAWFVLIHVDIEARAADALQAIQVAFDAAAQGQENAVESALETVYRSVNNMITTFHRMPEGCDPNIYYFAVRPYIFGFNDIIYEGVPEFECKPQSFRGQTGAQSSIIPALVAALGLKHEQTGLTDHLDVMKHYMPKPHREFLAQMTHSTIRDYIVEHQHNSALVEAYNQCLHKMTEFRSLHYHFATEYIFRKVSNPVGTGGTIFMDWLKQLIGETEQQLV